MTVALLGPVGEQMLRLSGLNGPLNQVHHTLSSLVTSGWLGDSLPSWVNSFCHNVSSSTGVVGSGCCSQFSHKLDELSGLVSPIVGRVLRLGELPSLVSSQVG